MKPFYLIISLFLLGSCAAGRIKKVNLPKVEREVISNSHFEQTTIDRTDTYVAAAISEEITHDEVITVEVSGWSEHINESISEDSDSSSTTNKIIAAVQAERKAKTSNKELTASLITTLVSFLFPPLLLISIVLIILGSVHYAQAKNSRYITEYGERKLKQAKKLLITSSILTFLFLLGIGILLLLFFL